MTSTRRCSELQALVFDPKYIQLKPKGAGVALYFSPEFMRKIQRPNQVNDPWCIPAIPTGKSDFASNCPVRALRYFHRYITEHPEFRKGRRRLFLLSFFKCLILIIYILLNNISSSHRYCVLDITQLSSHRYCAQDGHKKGNCNGLESISAYLDSLSFWRPGRTSDPPPPAFFAVSPSSR